MRRLSLPLGRCSSSSSLESLVERLPREASRAEFILGSICCGLVRTIPATSVVYLGGDKKFVPTMVALALQEAGRGTLQLVDVRCPYRVSGAGDNSHPDPYSDHMMHSRLDLQFSQIVVTHSTLDDFSGIEGPIDLAILDADASFFGVEHDFEKFAQQANYVLLWDSGKDVEECPAFPSVRQFAKRLKQPWIEISTDPGVVLIENRPFVNGDN